MNILFAASEAAPLAKTGGLADVVGALPKALAERGAEAAVILPKYKEIPERLLEQFSLSAAYNVKLGWRNQRCVLWTGKVDGVRFYLIENDYYYDRGQLYGYGDEAERFVFFCFAVLEAIPYLDDRPELIHCHDWQTGLIPFLLKTRYSQDPACRGIRTIFTIHNLFYQGVFSYEVLSDLLGVGPDMFSMDRLEYYGGGSCMKAGLMYADKLTTVSRTYAEEIQGEEHGAGLDGVLRLRSKDLKGVVNGIDIHSYDPMNDPAIRIPFKGALGEKSANKLLLQEELGLVQDGGLPMIGIVSRIVEQKGFDLIETALNRLLQEQVQFVVIGTGDPKYESMLRDAAERHPSQVVYISRFDEALARRIYASSDLYLMPSRFEPCGISQLIALRYGAVPIVRATGGLKDTIQAYDEYTGIGNGFCFIPYCADAMLEKVLEALALYTDEAKWQRLVANGVNTDVSWSSSAREYVQVYRELAGNGKE